MDYYPNLDGVDKEGLNFNSLTGDSEEGQIPSMTEFGGFCSSNNALWISTLYFSN